jgi:hypothetical protein
MRGEPDAAVKIIPHRVKVLEENLPQKPPPILGFKYTEVAYAVVIVFGSAIANAVNVNCRRNLIVNSVYQQKEAFKICMFPAYDLVPIFLIDLFVLEDEIVNCREHICWYIQQIFLYIDNGE